MVLTGSILSSVYMGGSQEIQEMLRLIGQLSSNWSIVYEVICVYK